MSLPYIILQHTLTSHRYMSITLKTMNSGNLVEKNWWTMTWHTGKFPLFLSENANGDLGSFSAQEHTPWNNYVIAKTYGNYIGVCCFNHFTIIWCKRYYYNVFYLLHTFTNCPSWKQYISRFWKLSSKTFLSLYLSMIFTNTAKAVSSGIFCIRDAKREIILC